MLPSAPDTVTEYSVFPGITLTYYNIHSPHCERSDCGRDVLEINHCREGRMECGSGDRFFYLTEGDLSISLRRSSDPAPYFPPGHYLGVSIAIDVNSAPSCLSCLLEDVNVQPAALLEKFCGGGDCLVARSEQSIEHIFSELYSVPDSIRKGYFKVKILELLLFLSAMPVSREQRRRLSGKQSQLAKDVCLYLTAHMDSRVTIDGLAAVFHVSPTQLKTCFRGVYGTSVYAYIREQKMRAAAQTLANTDMTVLEIAGIYGYDNGSKFAKAFRDTFGISPNEYRSSISGCES